MAKPTVPIHRSTGIEHNEKPVDVNAVEEQYKARGINVGHYTMESRHGLVPRLGKRNSPIYSETCGKVDIKSCSTLLETQSGVTAVTENCSHVNQLRFNNLNDCEVTFFGHKDKPVCISQARLTGLARKIFNQCVNNPAVGFGGCFDLEDTGHVCIRNVNIKDLIICT